MAKNLGPFFNPNSVAIIGASRNPQKIGHIVLKNFVDGFAGNIYPINPEADQILNIKAYPSVKAVPEELDLAVVLTPAKTVAEILKECGEKKVKAVAIITSGFKEIGQQGVKLEAQLEQIIKKYKLNVIGPNCLGVFDTASQVDMLFLPAYRLGRPQKGPIAFVTQSGAFGSVILDWAAQEGFGISKFISYGNAIDVDETDLLEYLGNDPETKVVTMYIEGAHRARDLMEV